VCMRNYFGSLSICLSSIYPYPLPPRPLAFYTSKGCLIPTNFHGWGLTLRRKIRLLKGTDFSASHAQRPVTTTQEMGMGERGCPDSSPAATCCGWGSNQDSPLGELLIPERGAGLRGQSIPAQVRRTCEVLGHLSCLLMRFSTCSLALGTQKRARNGQG
jgi:hypothetical protein